MRTRLLSGCHKECLVVSWGIQKEGSMATGSNIKTFFNGQWHDGDIAVMKAADHGAWLGSGVFDGARYFNGVVPDL